MESFKKRSIIGFILGLTMILSFTPLGAFTSKVYAATMIDRIDIESTTTSVEAGVLPGFTASTTTEHASIKESDSNNFWVRWPAGASTWEGFLSDTKAAFNDGSTRYGLRLRVYLEDGYQFSDNTQIYFNGVKKEEYTNMVKSLRNGNYDYFFYIDLGLATTGTNPITHTVTFDTDGGTPPIESRTIVDGYKTSKPSDPTKKGYIFKGWYTDKTYTTEFNFKNGIKADTTIYAKWEALVINEIRISSTTISVEAGALPSFDATTATEHATIEAYGSNTCWLKWKDGASSWSGFGSDYEMAVNDGKTHYGLSIHVNISDDYQFSDSAKVYFNDEDVTTKGHTEIKKYSWGGYVIIDLGLATGDFVTATSYEELKAAVDGCDGSDGTDLATNHVKLGADITVPASDYLRMNVITDFILDLNGYTLDVTNNDASMSICYGSNELEQFTSGSLTITDTSASQTGTIKVGYKPIFVNQYNNSNTGMHYKLTIDGGRFYGKSGANNVIFEFHTDNEYYWKDKSIIFDFKIEKGYFEHISTNAPAIVFANDSKLNNVTFNLSFDNLTFKAGAARLMTSNETYTMNDVVPEDTNFYIFNLAEDKQILITERTTAATIEVPSSLWYNIDGYTDPNYYGIKLVKQDGFNVTAPTFDTANYGYSSASAKGIAIYNRGTSDLQVKSVAVDDTSKFTVTGSTQPTITSKATDDTSFTIQPVDGLDAGTYTAIITVTDMADNTYTATVKFIVEKADITPTLSVSDVEYGIPVNPTITGNTGSGTIEYHYIDSDENDTTTKPVNAGSYKVYAIIGETTNYNGATTSQENFTISPKSITPTVDTIANKTYTGSEIKPTVVVKDGSTTLTKGTDYEVTYSDNINAGIATATISEVTNGNYTFSDKDVSFTIIKKQLEKVTLRTDEFEYTGLETYLEMEMDNYNSSLLELSGTLDAVDVGDYTTTVSLKDSANYEWVDGTTGNLTLNWKIIHATITDASVTLPQTTYKVTGSEITPEPEVVLNRTLTKDTDYTVSYTNNINIGTATVTVTGKNNYTGTVNKNFTIVAKDSQTITFTNSTVNKTYGDSNFTMTANRTVGTGTVTYSSSNTDVAEVNSTTGLVTIKKVGTTTITATASENEDYAEAAASYDLTVDKKEISYTATVKDKTYNGNVTAEVENVTITGLVETEILTKDTDYTVSATFEDSNIGTNKNVNVTLTLKETTKTANYELTGTSYVATASVTAKEIQDTDVTLETTTYTYDGTAKEPSVTVKVDGNTLTKGTDYEVVYTNNVNAGTATAKITAKEGSNYTLDGEVTKDFTINPMTITPIIADIAALVYNGSEQTPALTVTGDSKTLVKDTDYTVAYENNTFAGTATAKITAKVGSNYTWSGTVDKEFTITPKMLAKPTLSVTYTYNENEQTATLENFNATTMNVTNNTRTEAGSQDITVSLKDTTNYAWVDGTTTDVIIPFEIAKATPTIVLENLSQKEGSVTAVTYTVTPATTDGTVKVEYKVSTADDTTYTETLPTKNGTYTVKVSIAGDSNLEDTQNTATLTITRKTSSSGGGGSAATTKYTITVKQNSNGKISPETVKVEKGNDQKFAIKANAGYEIEDVKVDDKSVGAVKEYTFENVKAAHTIEATFKKVEEVVPVEPEDGWKNPFADVSEDDWYYEAVKFANENKLFNGVSENEFGANVNMTRGMLVTVLYRLAGEPATNKSIPFADVDTAVYYANPISWAKQNGIVNGVDENNFAPNAEISRQQLVTILYRFAKLMGKDVSVGEDTNILSYDDVNQVAEYAIPALQWACGAGVITGRTESTLAPIGNATRAEVATMLMRFINN